MRRPLFSTRQDAAGFTLVELMVSMGVLSLLGYLAFTLVNQTQMIWRRTTAKIEAFQGARTGFDALTRRLSQATLNTYWDYYDQNGKRLTGGAPGVPTQYGRYSELHFASGAIGGLLPEKTSAFTHGVFFQAPLGFAALPAARGLEHLLDAGGFYVEFNSDSGSRPPFLPASVAPRWRFRLMEVSQPSEALAIYQASAKELEWAQKAADDPANVRVLAENIVALVVLPKYSAADAHASFATDYRYDSHAPIGSPQRHQLPPLVQVTLVAIDETSAQRMSAGSVPPPLLAGLLKTGDTPLFTQAKTEEDYTKDLKKLVARLQEAGVGYRVFSAAVGIRAAKWSAK